MRRASLRLAIQIAARANSVPIGRARLRRLALAVLERDAAITLRFVDRAEGRALNSAYRGRDYATNVLTFAYDQALPPGERLSADIVVCLPVARAEARQRRIPLDDHLAHLWIHGVLHAQGYDHEQPADALRMESIETRALRRFGIANPYEVEGGRALKGQSDRLS